MALMRERYTGVVFDVSDEKVGKRISQGYVLVGNDPEKREERKEPEQEQERPPKEPDEGSTIAEIREYAKAVGVKLPRSGSKADLLAALQ